VRPIEIENPLLWWANHVMQFPHMFFLACQVMGIISIQIKTQWIFSIINIIRNLWSRLIIELGLFHFDDQQLS
jgi:uncharacterized membrane protein